MTDTTIDHKPVTPGLRVWDYDLRPAIVGEVDHIAQDGTAWYTTTSLDGSRRGMFDAKRMWYRHPSDGRLA